MDNNLLKIEELYVNAEDKEILKGVSLTRVFYSKK